MVRALNLGSSGQGLSVRGLIQDGVTSIQGKWY